jgi:hypothetical protein
MTWFPGELTAGENRHNVDVVSLADARPPSARDVSAETFLGVYPWATLAALMLVSR